MNKWDWSTIGQACGIAALVLAIYLPILWYATKEKRDKNDR